MVALGLPTSGDTGNTTQWQSPECNLVSTHNKGKDDTELYTDQKKNIGKSHIRVKDSKYVNTLSYISKGKSYILFLHHLT